MISGPLGHSLSTALRFSPKTPAQSGLLRFIPQFADRPHPTHSPTTHPTAMATTKAVLLAAVAFFSGVTTIKARAETTFGVRTVTLYDSPGFHGEAFVVVVTPYQCINVVSTFNDRASSALWFAPDKTGSIIYFYEHENCQGAMRQWPADEQNFPNNFAVDGIDNMVSSIKVRGGY